MRTPTLLAALLCTVAAWPAMAQTVLVNYTPNEARLLASGCFQCHGTNGKSGAFDALAGDGKADMLNKLNEMRKKLANGSIMYPHARGYTSYQLDLIAQYFSVQK
ncbi:MAG: cytochrome C [Limnohabitans sp.]